MAGQVSAFVQARWLGTLRKSQGPYMWKEHAVSVPLRHPRAKLETWGQAGGVAVGGVSEWVRSRPPSAVGVSPRGTTHASVIDRC